MKTMRLAFILAALSSPAVGLPPAGAQEQITITDPTEFQTYEKALSLWPSAEKAAALEAFLAKYPDTVVKAATLNTLLTTYQQANDTPNMLATARRILNSDPNNLRAAFAYVYLTKQKALSYAAGATPLDSAGKSPYRATGGAPFGATGPAPINASGSAPFGAAGPAPKNAAAGAPTVTTARPPLDASGEPPLEAGGTTPVDATGREQSMLGDAATVARQALKVTAPTPGSGVSDEEFLKLKAATTPIFLSVIAADDAGKRDFQGAIATYEAELQSYPNLDAPGSAPGINETYLLGQAFLQQEPRDIPNGVFYLARAAQYAPSSSKESVEKAAEYWYRKYHGGMDGFDGRHPARA